MAPNQTEPKNRTTVKQPDCVITVFGSEPNTSLVTQIFENKTVTRFTILCLSGWNFSETSIFCKYGLVKLYVTS